MTQPPVNLGKLSIFNSMAAGQGRTVRLRLDDGRGRVLVELSVSSADLMDALMRNGDQPCTFMMWPGVTDFTAPTRET